MLSRTQFEPPDGVTIVNAVFGYLAIIASIEPALSARLILVAVVADGLDGVLARAGTSSHVGALLDSLVDIVSFGVAPAVFVYGVAHAAWGLTVTTPTLRLAIVVLITAVFVVSAVVRTVLYTVDGGGEFRAGVPNTLAATILAAMVLSGLDNVVFLLLVTVVLSFLMLARVPYPGLPPSDAFGMGCVLAGAILVPGPIGLWLARVLLVCALGYLTLAPIAYRQRGIQK